ncbi:unnamed protein product [Protopolystoma xenopodis]|uniref:Uncharacterized protein n=1 Tax=Protopolystoma xenopodis TaxID=117903 RepID=A0A448XP31_9PLAT|nr:unnamed protein product [Protopolystoma xenopodis]
MARLADDADYDAGEMSENALSQWFDAWIYDNYYCRGLWTKCVRLGRLDNITKLRKQDQTRSRHRIATAWLHSPHPAKRLAVDQQFWCPVRAMRSATSEVRTHKPLRAVLCTDNLVCMRLQISPTSALAPQHKIMQQPDLERGSKYSREGGVTRTKSCFLFLFCHDAPSYLFARLRQITRWQHKDSGGVV